MTEKAGSEKADDNPVSVIASDIVITGNLEASQTLQFDGRITGDVRCATLILSEGSVIKGSVSADRVRVWGTIDGGIDTKDLAVEATARITGDVSYERLKVASGGVVQGNMTCKAPEAEDSEGGKLKLVEPLSGTKEPAIHIE